MSADTDLMNYCKHGHGRKSPFALLYDAMKVEVEQLGIAWSPELFKDLPKKWEKHGDMVILPENAFTSDSWRMIGRDLWKIVAKCLKVKNVGRKRRIAADDFRTPHVELLYGQNGWVEHVDNGIRYQYDVTRCMFSIGNISEKLRIAELNCNGEVIVDLFAGIGYFVLPYLVHAGATYVHACEWNPDAIEALHKNLEVNNVSEKCTIYEGDCRKVCPVGVADRVNLGLLPTAFPYWLTACKALKAEGGVLHIHENVTSVKAPNKAKGRQSSLDCVVPNSKKTVTAPFVRHLSSVDSADIPEADYELELELEPEMIDYAAQPEACVNTIVEECSGQENGFAETNGIETLALCEGGSSDFCACSKPDVADSVEETGICSAPEDTVPFKKRPSRRLSTIILNSIDEDSRKPYVLKVSRGFVDKWDTIDPAWREWAIRASRGVLRFLNNLHLEEWGGRLWRVGRVKKYAPHIDHLVMDLEVRPIFML